MRIRTVKPAFFKDEVLAELSPLHRLLFQGLWLIADGHGRLEDRPKRIKIEVLPYDDCDTHSMLNDLEKAQFIVRYVVNNIGYIFVPGFKRNQRITGKEAEEESKFPPYPDEKGLIESTEKHLRNNGETANVQEGKGKEGKGKDMPANAGPGQYVPKTPIQKIVTAFKLAIGIPKEDKSWDKIYYPKYSKPAKEILELFGGDIGTAINCIESITNHLNKNNLSWTPHTIVKHAGNWKHGKFLK